jgi:endonuclease/exonuclease/phosphatase family metal-dependent hydrolase
MRNVLWGAALCIALFSKAQGDTLTLLTYNIRYDNPADGLDRWDLRKGALAQVVRDLHPQVIGLQEALAHQLSYLDTQWPGYQRYGVGRDDGDAKGEFSAVYFDTTVFTLQSGRTIWLSETPEKPSKGWDAACERIATYVELRNKATGDGLWVVNTHWDHVGTKARHHSAQLVLDLVDTPLRNGLPVVVMGDLNATPDEEPVRHLAERLVDACPVGRDHQGTFNGFEQDPKDPKRIDHVLLSPGSWLVAGYEVPSPRVNGRQVSDHYPVLVVLSR